MSLSETLLAQLSLCINRDMGLYFPRERWAELTRGLFLAAKEFEFDQVELFGEWLVSPAMTKQQIEILARYLAVGETYFFRGQESFDVLQTEVLPELYKTRRPGKRFLRIWSVGCSTGEEPYSLAILLDQLLPDIRRWNITILGSDMNTASLRKAAGGIYSDWSFRLLPLHVKKNYFREIQPGQYEILPRIKQMVTFTYLNLVKDEYPSLSNGTSAMDIIFCRNVLIYFSPDARMRVIQQLYQSLREGGWFIVSPTETSQIRFSQFIPVRFPKAFFFLKETAPSPLPEQSPGKETANTFLTSPEKFILANNNKNSPSGNIFSEGEPCQKPFQTDSEQQAIMVHKDECISSPDHYPLGGKAYEFLAQAFANAGNLQEALRWCEKAIAIDKMNAEFHFLRAKILQQQSLLKRRWLPSDTHCI